MKPVSSRATLKRIAERGEYDAATIRQILDAQQVCHVAYVDAGEPRQIATLYMCDDDYLYLHGNRQSALLKHMAAGGEVVTGEAHRRCLDKFVEVLIPGHEKVVREPTRQELAATTVVRIHLQEMVAKVRAGDPIDAEDDLDSDVWAGEIPLRNQSLAPVPAANLSNEVSLPGYIQNFKPRG